MAVTKGPMQAPVAQMLLN